MQRVIQGLCLVLAGSVLLAACQRPPEGRGALAALSAPAVSGSTVMNDEQIRKRYLEWPDKGPLSGPRRITVLVSASRVRVGEELLVYHVAESTSPDAYLYTMGPKPIEGEEVDSEVPSSSAPVSEDPFSPPGLYDGPMVPGPAVDTNFEVTRHRFSSTGRHRIQWVMGGLRSNELQIDVVE